MNAGFMMLFLAIVVEIWVDKKAMFHCDSARHYTSYKLIIITYLELFTAFLTDIIKRTPVVTYLEI